MHDKIKNIHEFKSVLLGRINFKNVDKPVTVFALANQGLVVPQRNSLDGKLKAKSLLHGCKISFHLKRKLKCFRKIFYLIASYKRSVRTKVKPYQV